MSCSLRWRWLIGIIDGPPTQITRSCHYRHFSVGSTTALFDRCQDGRTLVLNEDDEKLRRVCLAGVATDNVNVIGTFIEGLTRMKGDRLLPLNLHYDGAFQHINECVRVMAMDGVHCARRILDDQDRALFTGEIG